MPATNQQLFTDSPTLRVHNVALSALDDIQTHREKLARIVLDELHQFVGLLDANGNTLEINQAALQGAGIKLDDVQGKPFWEARWWLVSKETQAIQRELVRRAREGEFVRCDIEVYKQAGGEQTIMIDYSLSPIRGQDGKIVFLLAEGRNIAEEKQAATEIARQNRELETQLDKIRRLDRLKTDFFANVSHALRTPLALILAPAQSILAAGTNLTEVQRRDLGVIHRNAATLRKHVNDLLDLSKLDEGRQTVNYASIDLARETRTIAANFHSLASERSLSYAIETPKELPAELDPGKFDRILLNLLSNAFKYTPAGGRIRCTLEMSPPDRILLIVQDNGPGVDPGMREVIFERFRQAKSDMTRAFAGTGLGLAIVKDFVSLHGGTIRISDAPGGGALFQVELPLRAPHGAVVSAGEPSKRESGLVVESVQEELSRHEPAAALDPASMDPASIGLPVVLISEDDAEMRAFVAGVLGDLYRIVQCADGAEALAKAIADPPDAVVTDLMMPKLGGDRLAEEMRRVESLAHVPILVLSAVADEDVRVRLLEKSVQDYLVKPFSAQELRARVRNLVVMKRSRDLLQKELASQNEDLSELTRQLVASRQELRNCVDALSMSEERWRSIFDNSAVGIALTDAHGVFTATNRAYQEMVGYSEEELLGMSYIDITFEEDQPRNRELATDFWKGKFNRFTQEKRYRRKDGKLIWVRKTVSLVPGTETAPRFGMAVVEDITERKRIEDTLWEYEKAVEGLEEMIVVVDRGYRYLIANRAFLAYMGLEREQLIGRLVPDMTADPGVFENIVKAKLDECLRGNVVKYELKYSYPARGERDLSVSYFPIEGANGIDRVACVLQDITERKQSEAALHALSGRILTLEDEARRRLARGLHDTTAQSLAALCMNLSVVSESAEALNPRAREAVAQSVNLADQCLREIRTVSYLLHPPELDALGLEFALSRYIDGFIERSGIRVELDVSPDLGRLPQPVETAIFRVVQECLTNIHRHSGSSSARVRLMRGGSQLILEVEDAGRGIPQDAPSGVGIASMRERLQQLNGSLEIVSHPGGTTVKATIPLQAPI